MRISIPVQAGHSFTPNPTPELAYVIGVQSGDGSPTVRLDRYQYRVRLKAVDAEFVEAFYQAVGSVLGCPPHRLERETTSKETYVEFGSHLLHKFLLQKLDDQKIFVEHDNMCAAAFIRGFFDSEGCFDVSGSLTATNCDLSLLHYVQERLKRFLGIEKTGPYVGKKKGSIPNRRGESYFRNADCCSIYVRRACLATFHREIGLTIERKKIRLERKLGLR
jgi:intein-encoded DNA endonuclease-like protein